MQKQIEKDILIFSESTGYGTDFEIDHGSVYASFKNAQDAAWYRSALEYFMNDAYKCDLPTRVNIYKLWKANKKDVYAFDIVEYNDRLFNKNKGPVEEIPHDVDVMLNLQNERALGK